MDDHGQIRANHAVVTSNGRRALLDTRFAVWLLAAIFTIAAGRSLLAKDIETVQNAGRVQSQNAESGETTSAARPVDVPGIRQPDYATPVGGMAREAEMDNEVIQPSPIARVGAFEEPATRKSVAPAVKKPTTAQPESTWSALWQQVFGSADASESEKMPDETVDDPVARSELHVASQTSSAGNDLLQKVIPSSYLAGSQDSVVRPSGDMDEVPPPSSNIGEPGRLGQGAAVLGGLSRQFTMRSDETVVPASATIQASARTGEAEEARKTLDDSALLLPFKLTNPASAPSRANSSVASGTTGSQTPRGVFGSSPLSMLGGQLTMSTSDDYRSLAKSVDESPMLSDEAGGDQGMTISLPGVTNPFTLSYDPASSVESTGRTRLVAYQEALPTPPPQDGDDAFKDDAAQRNSDSGEAQGGESKTLVGAERVGERPEDNTLQFLRTQTVLLEPGESQCDIGINYLFSENRFPILLLDNGIPVGTDDVLFRIRELTIPLEYRVGLLKRVQGFIGAPIGWSNTQVAIGDYEQFQNDGGFGDLDFGATIQVIDGNAECPHGLFTIMATAPTGGDPFGPAPVLAQSAPSLGQGFWSITANALCIQTYDPLVFFYGVGAEHFFSREFNNREIEPGNSWNYSFGVGFAVNDRVTLSTRFLGSYVEEVRVNRQRVLGTNVEPMTIRMAATISKPCDRIVEPFIEFGITESAIDSFLGITWTY